MGPWTLWPSWGVLRVGAKADVTIFEHDRLAAGKAYLVEDFPAGSGRYVVDAEGYRYTIVNGEVLMEGSRHTGALPGEVLQGA